MKPIKTCENIMALLETWGNHEHVSIEELRKAISWERGVDERTTERWIRALETFGFITRENKIVYSINQNAPHTLIVTPPLSNFKGDDE